MKEKGFFKKIIVLLLCAVIAVNLLPSHSFKAESGDRYLMHVIAQYIGDTVPVGSKINKKYITVSAMYSDGTFEDVTDYTLSSETVKKAGINTVDVVYHGATCSITIPGKAADKMYLGYIGGPITIGNKVNREELSLYVYYTDGSMVLVKDYELTNDVITSVGPQLVTAVYGNMTASTYVEGVAIRAISGLDVSYEGGDVIQGNSVRRDLIRVTALYADGSTERISNYDIEPEVIKNLGTNTVTVSYRSQSASFKVNCIVKTLVGIEAVYNEQKVEIGKNVEKADTIVRAKYDDGTTEEVEDYEFAPARILIEGDNRVTITYRDFETEIIVMGVKSLPANYNRSSSFTIKNTKVKGTMYVALPNKLAMDVLEVKSLKPTKVKKVIGKLKDHVILDYIAFDVLLADETQDDIFPLETRIRIPNEYTMEEVHLYFTPNKKTVIGEMNIEWYTQIQFDTTLFHAGTYILTREEVPNEDEEDEDGADSEDDYL